uniref:PGG domain-containing protein n=1 Tax=Arundo donax TaxID=35708 RepID=A0A0A8Z805_ARUDO
MWPPNSLAHRCGHLLLPCGAAAITSIFHGTTTLLLNWKKDLTKQQDITGSTPMHFAASADDPSLEFFLFVFMERTLEFYSFGIYFAPAKCLVKFYGWLNLPIYQLVQSDPSSAFLADLNGQFPVHVAASAGNLVAVIVLLTKCPGCAGLRDSRGRTFLHMAVEKKSQNIVKFVCLRPEFESILNIQDNQGNTALHLAILGGHLCIFQSLITNPYVRLNLPNEEGNTPMDLSESKASPGFYFGMHARRRIHGTLKFTNAQNGNCRRDRFKDHQVPLLDESEESKKITEFAQIVGICSVLVATATFAAVFTMPGGFRTDDSSPSGSPSLAPAPVPAGGPGPAGTPIMAGKYAFDGFVIANTLAFSCSTIATFSLVYCGMAAVDIEKRIKLVSLALALLNGSARSFCAAFAFALYLLLSPVARATAIATAAMTALVLLDALRFLWLLFVDTAIVLNRKVGPATLLKLGTAFIVNMVYLFWPYIVIFGLLGNHTNSALRGH